MVTVAGGELSGALAGVSEMSHMPPPAMPTPLLEPTCHTDQRVWVKRESSLFSASPTCADLRHSPTGLPSQLKARAGSLDARWPS